MKKIKLILRILSCIWGSCIVIPFGFFVSACIFMIPVSRWMRYAGEGLSETSFAVYIFLVFGVGAILLFGSLCVGWFKFIKYMITGG